MSPSISKGDIWEPSEREYTWLLYPAMSGVAAGTTTPPIH